MGVVCGSRDVNWFSGWIALEICAANEVFTGLVIMAFEDSRLVDACFDAPRSDLPTLCMVGDVRLPPCITVYGIKTFSILIDHTSPAAAVMAYSLFAFQMRYMEVIRRRP